MITSEGWFLQDNHQTGFQKNLALSIYKNINALNYKKKQSEAKPRIWLDDHLYFLIVTKSNELNLISDPFVSKLE